MTVTLPAQPNNCILDLRPRFDDPNINICNNQAKNYNDTTVGNGSIDNTIAPYVGNNVCRIGGSGNKRIKVLHDSSMNVSDAFSMVLTFSPTIPLDKSIPYSSNFPIYASKAGMFFFGWESYAYQLGYHIYKNATEYDANPYNGSLFPTDPYSENGFSFRSNCNLWSDI